MKKEFSKIFMEENCGCYSISQLNGCSFMATEVITLEAILNSEIPIKDKFWFVCKKLATKEQSRLIAIGVAEIVLELYENKYPNNKAPREAIQAAKDYLNGTINLQELGAKRLAAAVAADAAAVAAAAYYAADAAAAYAAYYAAYYAADAAYYAAYYAAADAAAAYAAYYATYAAAYYAATYAADGGKDYKNLLLIFLHEFCKNS